MGHPMKENHTGKLLQELARDLSGDLLCDRTSRLLYATDASAYREIPLAVARPRNREDIVKLVRFARLHSLSLIPRTAGTSLAGQVVGPGVVVDAGRYMTGILEFNPDERWVRVEPGVILDELNRFVAPYGLFFGPETSTSSRCMIGGMVGNNSCGAHSILYGSMRDHLLSVKAVLSDGTETEFGDVSPAELERKCSEETLEGSVYRTIRDILSDPVNRAGIRDEFPDPAIHRRNTGYAIDLLLDTEPFAEDTGGVKDCFNMCRILAGSEGTLAFITEITLNLVPLPPKEKGLVCVHCHNLEDALKANLVALAFQPGSVEMMDRAILDCTRENITQRKNRFFLQGDPGAVLIVEFARETRDEIISVASGMEKEIRNAGLGFAFPLIFKPDIDRVWALRKAGLGVLSNYPGDRKPVAVTEDTAVTPESLPAYIEEFSRLMERLGLNCVYHAHSGSGELHLRPVLNLKDPEDVELFHTVAIESARLVKKYRGSLSGEHGDGRLRGEFIPFMIGERNYQLLEGIKHSWDPCNIFNPGKITGTPPMNSSLRYEPGRKERNIETLFDFSDSLGILRAAEKCNGSGDCRNTHLTGATMCPSYMALREEHTTTRARANLLREFLTTSGKRNPFDHPEIFSIMDLCLSCKACKSECPSNVDMTRLKAEFLQHWYDSHGVPPRTWLIGNIPAIQRLGSLVPAMYNFFLQKNLFTGILNSFLGFAPERHLPALSRTTLRNWLKRELTKMNASLKKKNGSLYLFVDEFTDFNDSEVGISFVQLLNALGYEVLAVPHPESGRAYLSKGMLRKARKLARKNVGIFSPLLSSDRPLVGLEPSAILSFRDEYPDLVGPLMQPAARSLREYVLLYDEFLEREVDKGLISPEQFTKSAATVKLHGHCHQKALASVRSSVRILSLPANYKVEEIPSGCCGMAGSFGYEKEHYEVSMKIGELVLFPEIRKSNEDVIISAPGTSCRHQIRDGTGRKAIHPVEVLWAALE